MFFLTPAEWDKLVANEADKLRWIKEAVQQLRYYRGEVTEGGDKE